MASAPSGPGKFPGFAEIKPLLKRDEALAEANRCLFCYDAPCIRSCPTSIDIPGFIKKIATDNLKGSARTILEANILGASCARVCPTEELCEGACVMHDLHEKPIQIGRLQRYSTEPVVLGDKPMFTSAEANGKRVAMIGAGPASLSCGAVLAREGYHIDIYEANAKAGGLNTYGVADYKMDYETSLAEVAWIEQMGVNFHFNKRVGHDIAFETLLADYDAVFLGTGLGKISTLGMDGEDLDGVADALDFIESLKIHDKQEVALTGKRVAVIGGGNTAIDASIQSACLNAEHVYMVYRRDAAQMGAYDHEVVHGKKEGVEFVYLAQPKAILGEQGKVMGLECLRTTLDPDTGRPSEVAGSEFVLKVDRVLRATGQTKHKDFYTQIGIDIDKGGRVVVNEHNQTSNAKVWAGGDCVNGGKEVVNAVEEGKIAAAHIHASLTGSA